MYRKKIIPIIMIAIGLALFFVSVYGYNLGIARHETFGAFQWTGTIVGAVVFFLGVFRLMSRK